MRRLRGGAGAGDLKLTGSNGASGGLRFTAAGMWRQELPRPTPAQRRVLAAMARGDVLEIDPAGAVRLRDAGSVPPRTVAIIIERDWASAPLPALPLFDEPARDGGITPAGQAALARGLKQW